MALQQIAKFALQGLERGAPGRVIAVAGGVSGAERVLVAFRR
jgi:hypothetical protein